MLHFFSPMTLRAEYWMAYRYTRVWPRFRVLPLQAMKALADWILWLRLMEPNAVLRNAAREQLKAEMQDGAKAIVLGSGPIKGIPKAGLA